MKESTWLDLGRYVRVLCENFFYLNLFFFFFFKDLPESVPRFVVLSYEWKMENDRVSYPLVFIYYGPEANAKLNMLYASTKPHLSRALDLNKEFDIRSRDELTEEWLKKKLEFFK